MNCEHEAFTDNDIKHGDDENTKAGELQTNGENSVEMQDEADENDEIKKYIQYINKLKGVRHCGISHVCVFRKYAIIN